MRKLCFFQVLPEGGIGLLQHCQLCLLSSICIAMSLRRVLHNFNKLWDAFISFSMMAEGPEISNLAFCNISKANSAVLCCVHNISKGWLSKGWLSNPLMKDENRSLAHAARESSAFLCTSAGCDSSVV